MPGNILNTLYPPVISTFMPAFVRNTDALVYFSLSPYNNSDEIKRVHVSLQNQLNNENAFGTYPGGIMVTSLRYDSISGLYYVVIPYTTVQGGMFNINQFYKVQIRFDNCPNYTVSDNGVSLTNYLLNNQQYFSEWSSICLIRPIEQPIIRLRTFEDAEGNKQTISFNKGIIPISGTVFFGESGIETETVQSYNLEILSKDGLTSYFKTKEIYTGDQLNPNGLDYKLDLQTLNTEYESDFKLKVSITTKNQYQTSKMYDFSISDYLVEDAFQPEISVEVDNEDGIATLHIKNIRTVFGTLYIKRGSSLDNFQSYESIWTDKVAGDIDLEITDNTIGSLVWYRYSVQLENSRGALTQVYRSEKFLPEFYDTIFSRGLQQLRVQYNYRISGYKPIVNRAKIDTLGGRYPKFVENAILNYKQFSISGSLSATNDENEKFLERSKYFGDEYNNYLIYNQETEGHVAYLAKDASLYINKETYEHNDFFWEREFRETALAWLNDGEPKLYRSMSEGNIVVMLTDVSLTPNIITGRRVWDFSATAYEIADASSLDTLDTLGVYPVHKIPEVQRGGGGDDPFNPGEEYVEVIKAGQLYNFNVDNRNYAAYENTGIVAGEIIPKLKERYGGVLDKRSPDGVYLKNIKIFFQSEPNWYWFTSDGQIQFVANPGDSIYTDADRNMMHLGYAFMVSTINTDGFITIFVNDRGYYQLPDQLDVDEIVFINRGQLSNTIPADIATIEYTIVYKEKNNVSTIISSSSVDRTVVGQVKDIFQPNEYLGEKIRSRYSFVQPAAEINGEMVAGYNQKMQFWKGLFVETMPYAVMHIQYKGQNEYHDYVVGSTGIYYMLQDVQVQDMCFLGRRMTKEKIDRQKYLNEWEYVILPGEYEDIDDITNPIFNGVYNIAGKQQIYYQYAWYNFTEDTETEPNTGIAHIPIEAMINYVGDIITSTF